MFFVLLHDTCRAFHFGDTSPQDRPLLYLYYIHALRETASSRFPSTPVIINTNGWVRGLGHPLLRNSPSSVEDAVSLMDWGFLPLECGLGRGLGGKVKCVVNDLVVSVSSSCDVLI